MSLRRDAHPGDVGRKSLSFFDGAVKPSLSGQAVDRSSPRHFMTKCPVTRQGIAKLARETSKGRPRAASLLYGVRPGGAIMKILRGSGVRILSWLT